MSEKLFLLQRYMLETIEIIQALNRYIERGRKGIAEKFEPMIDDHGQVSA
ncbi:hypothetical protein ACYCFC_19845 [Stutzerimonas sp. NM35]|nr:hypothetical protein [Stutzerimonas stutzeri]MBA1261465.1 hypothetical protein [Stutzerimonas stutzeri]